MRTFRSAGRAGLKACTTSVGIVVLAACAAQPPQRAGNAGPETGITLALATLRAREIQNVRYQLAFNIPPTVTDPIKGRATIRFATDRKSTRLNSSHIQKSRMPSSA